MNLLVAALSLSVAFGEAVVVEIPINSSIETTYVNAYAPDLTFTQTVATFPVLRSPGAITFSPTGDIVLIEQCDPPPCFQIKIGGATPFGDPFHDRLQSMRFVATGDLIAAFSYPATFKRFDANGRLIQTVAVPNGVISYPLNDFDVDRDQCTVVFSSQDVVAITNLCSPGGEWRTLSRSGMNVPLGGVRFLPSGNILVSASFAGIYGFLWELDRRGKLLREIVTSKSEVFGVGAIDPDGTSFWATSHNRLFRFDLATGAVIAGPASLRNGAYVRSMAIRGEWRAAMNPLPRRRSARH